MGKERLYSAQQVCYLVDCSVYTLNNWYYWKDAHPDHELAQLLPAPIQVGKRAKRYWKQEDVWKIIEFKSKVPRGNQGIMADITQRYVRNRKKGNKNGNR